MWSLHEDERELKPLIFSNGKSQADVVKEVIDAVKSGSKIIFIRGLCGTGKSAIALNLARRLGRTSIVVPIKSLQEQYTKDYSDKKYVLKDGKKLKISSIVGRKNFKCKFLEETDLKNKYTKEKNAKLFDIFEETKNKSINLDSSCDNNLLPCKIEIKEKNIQTIRDYIKQNSDVKSTDFQSISDVRRISIAPICPYWSPIISEDFETNRLGKVRKIKYKGLNNKNFVFYQRKPGCGFYDQYEAYADSDVLIFNSMKYKLETLMDRKPATEIEIIDECDEFLDSFANQEKININRALFNFGMLFSEDKAAQETINKLIDITNKIRLEYEKNLVELKEIENTSIKELLEAILENTEFLEKIELEDSNYLFHLDEVARIFYDFFDETFFSIEKKDKDIIIHLVTPNLAKRFKEIIEKNKVLIMMSGTIHSENVLKNIFALENFKIIEAETSHQGELIKCKHGYEFNCSYANFNSDKLSRENYLKALSKCLEYAKKPCLVHVTAFSDLPTSTEKKLFSLDNLPTQQELINEQEQDPLSHRVDDFKQKKIDVLFTTRCNRGIDFPGEICNSIVITRFPYPNISGIFWKILKKTNPENFMSFYMDKAKRELLQRIYRGLRNKNDKVELLSPDIRVLDFFNEKIYKAF
ncbi:MAG: helicase C-terminal domain-containing protein [Candidatus Nanoarchaeia archaeon]|nr:helicase C-terminal domain-containing protein [Candidatus Nanoarchaeia archaeon]MDD5741342.1 helicase C-terminal domain-containing protein [Candidatus Nanoarchaeia archaeon]